MTVELAHRLVPGYIDTAHPERWDALIGQLRPGDVVVMNPASGPGSQPDPGWTSVRTRLYLAGVKVYGYVPLNRGVPHPDVNRGDAYKAPAWSSAYARWYDTEGAFLDECPEGVFVSSQVAQIGASVLWSRRVNDPTLNSNATASARVWLNPGVSPSAALVRALPDAYWVTHENRDPNGPSIDDVGPPRTDVLPARRQAWLSYADPDPQRTMARLAELGWSWGYSCSDAAPLGNPWDGDPST